MLCQDIGSFYVGVVSTHHLNVIDGMSVDVIVLHRRASSSQSNAVNNWHLKFYYCVKYLLENPASPPAWYHSGRWDRFRQRVQQALQNSCKQIASVYAFDALAHCDLIRIPRRLLFCQIHQHVATGRLRIMIFSQKPIQKNGELILKFRSKAIFWDKPFSSYSFWKKIPRVKSRWTCWILSYVIDPQQCTH